MHPSTPGRPAASVSLVAVSAAARCVDALLVSVGVPVLMAVTVAVSGAGIVAEGGPQCTAPERLECLADGGVPALEHPCPPGFDARQRAAPDPADDEGLGPEIEESGDRRARAVLTGGVVRDSTAGAGLGVHEHVGGRRTEVFAHAAVEAAIVDDGNADVHGGSTRGAVAPVKWAPAVPQRNRRHRPREKEVAALGLGEPCRAVQQCRVRAVHDSPLCNSTTVATPAATSRSWRACPVGGRRWCTIGIRSARAMYTKLAAASAIT